MPSALGTAPNTENSTQSKLTIVIGQLCELQALTGLGILVAGMTQWDRISFYHEQLVMCYYSMTFNSFWAGRVSYMNCGARGGERRLFVRRASLLISIILSIVWRSYSDLREHDLWDDDDTDEQGVRKGARSCYRYMDQSGYLFDFIFWNSGQLIFGAALMFFLIPRLRWLGTMGVLISRLFFLWLWNHVEDAIEEIRRSYPYDADETPRGCESRIVFATWKLYSRMAAVAKIAIFGTSIVIYTLVQEILEIWSFGCGFYPIT